MSGLKDQLQRTLAGTYTLERELGGGGMSRVFLAEETSLGRKVVVKVLPPDIYYRNGERVIETDVALGATLSLGARRPAFSLTSPSSLVGRGGSTYDVSPDGQRIIFAQPTGGDEKLVVIVNWFTAVRKKLREAQR